MSTYPGTQVLINKLGIRDGELLNQVEGQLSQQRLNELIAAPVRGDLTTSHLQGIHKHLFQDVYSWAGQIRKEWIGKDNVWFCRPDFIGDQMKEMDQKLIKSNFHMELDRPAFIDSVSRLWGDLNYLHPFREGNGRSTREYLRVLSAHAGYFIDWSRGGTNEILLASKQDRFETVLDKVVTNREPDRQLQATFAKSLKPEGRRR